MHLRIHLTDEERCSLEERSAVEGISVADLARRAIQEHLARSEHHSQVAAAADRIIDVHADAIERLAR